MVKEKARTSEIKDESAQNAKSRYSREGIARARFYWSLLLFIVVAGLLLLAVPTLRTRLAERSRDIYSVIRGTRAPLMASVSDPQSDYPEEYEREDYVFPDPGQGIPKDWMFRIPSEGSGEEPDGASALVSPPTRDPDAGLPAGKVTGQSAAKSGSGTEEPNDGIRYSTGEAETDAYNLLLEKYPKVAALVRGSDSSLQFLSWDGAEVQEGVYWVRLIFEAGGDREVYIWQVSMPSGDVEPLSYNARTVS